MPESKSLSDAETLLNIINDHEMLNLGGEAATQCISKIVDLLCEDALWTRKYMKRDDATRLFKCFGSFCVTGDRDLQQLQNGPAQKKRR